MTTFAASVLVKIAWQIRHTCVVFESSNKDEAMGKAMAYAFKVYPTCKNFNSHHVVVVETDRVVDIDKALPEHMVSL